VTAKRPPQLERCFGWILLQVPRRSPSRPKNETVPTPQLGVVGSGGCGRGSSDACSLQNHFFWTTARSVK